MFQLHVALTLHLFIISSSTSNIRLGQFISNFLVIPPEKPPPLKYHLFTQKLPSSNDLAEESESEAEDDIESKVTEERQQHSGSIVYTVECQVISPGTVIPGVLAITSDSLYFTADEEAPDMKRINQEVNF